MRVIAVSNSKGGVGKTTTAVTVAHGLALRGHRVLIVDLDAQGSAGHALGLGGRFKRTTFDLLVGNRSVEECVVKARKHLWLLPSDVGMAEAKDRIIAQAAVRAVASMAQGQAHRGGRPHDHPGARHEGGSRLRLCPAGLRPRR